MVAMLLAGSPEAPPAVLLHGYSGDFLTWQFQIGALARHFRVVALDLPGHGQSESLPDAGFWRDMVPWLGAVLAELGLHRPHLIGHSLGARVALGLAESGNAPVSLSLIACAGISRSYDFAFLRSLASIENLDDALACTARLFGDAAIDRDRFARALFQKLSPAPARAALAAYLTANFADGKLLPTVSVEWPRIACPVQLIWGRDDTVVEAPPPDWLPPGAPFHWLDRVGHMPHVAAPDAVNRLLREFCLEAQAQVSSVAAQE